MPSIQNTGGMSTLVVALLSSGASAQLAKAEIAKLEAAMKAKGAAD